MYNLRVSAKAWPRLIKETQNQNAESIHAAHAYNLCLLFLLFLVVLSMFLPDWVSLGIVSSAKVAPHPKVSGK